MNSKIESIINDISSLNKEELAELASYFPTDLILTCSNIRETQLARNEIEWSLRHAVEKDRRTILDHFSEDVLKDFYNNKTLIDKIVIENCNKVFKEREEKEKEYFKTFGENGDFIIKNHSDYSMECERAIIEALQEAEKAKEVSEEVVDEREEENEMDR